MPTASSSVLALYARAALPVLSAAALLAQVGCSSLPSGGGAVPPAGAAVPATPSNVEPPPPNVNLSGFPLPYRQGYADGCATAGGTERKDASRFSADGNYRTGWTDGRALCVRK